MAVSLKRWIIILILVLSAVGVQAGAIGTIRVTAAPSTVVGADCRVFWTMPTQNTDGSPATTLAATRLYWSSTSNAQVKGAYQYEAYPPATQVTCATAGITAMGPYFMKATAVNTQGVESAFSEEISFTVGTVGTVAPLPPTSLAVK